MTNSDEMLDWDELTPEDRLNAQKFLTEFNQLFETHLKKEEKPCEDSFSED